jgi:selenocysteine-specific elongation factor
MSARSVVIGTAGHIDHGKSALVRALTGTDPDRLKEEQERGITIDLGFAHLVAPGATLSFVDVPGHERFVKNMLAGAGGIDLVMLVVAADESVMPQTREHFDICRLLRVPAGIIVLTKIDVADDEMQELAALEVRELTAGSFLEDAPLLKVSARTGEGLAALTAALVQQSVRAPHRAVERPPRLPIDRVFTVKGFGTVVTGTLVAGRLDEGDPLTVLPRGLTVTARGLHVHGASRTGAVAGERVAVNLGGVDVAELSRGDTLCAAGTIESTRRLDAVIELLPDAPALRHGLRVRFHQGTTELIGRIAVAGPRHGEAPAPEIPAGGAAYARVRLEAPAVLTRGDRFIIRSYSPAVTVAGGVVLDPQPPRGAMRTAAGLRRFRALDVEPPDEARVVAALVQERGAAGLAQDALISRLGLSGATAEAIVARGCAGGALVRVGTSLVAPGALARLSQALLGAIRQHHADQPLADGLPREEARERLFSRAASGVFEHVLAGLAAEGRVVARDRLALAGHQVSLTAEEDAAFHAIDDLFKAAALAPPDMATAALKAKVQPEVADRIAKLLVRRSRLVRVDTLLFHVETLDQLRREVQAMKVAGVTGVDVGTFKDRYGLSRKYAIPLLEYLDRERVTRRAGAGRVIL